MNQSIGLVALVIRDYDEAIEFYCDKVGFRLLEDTYIPAQDKRWVVVAPPENRGHCRRGESSLSVLPRWKAMAPLLYSRTYTGICGI